MIGKLEPGNGIGFKILIDDKPVNFHLAVFATQDFLTGEYTRYEYGYLNKEHTLYSRNPYSGGRTGFGVSPYDIRPYPFTADDTRREMNMLFITDDLASIMELAKFEEAKALEKEQKFVTNLKDRVDRVNALPEKFEVDGMKTHIFSFERTEMVFNERMSKVQGGTILCKLNSVNGTISPNWQLFPSDFLSRSGNLLVQKFEREIFSLIKEEIPDYTAKEVLQLLVDKEKELNAMIKHI